MKLSARGRDAAAFWSRTRSPSRHEDDRSEPNNGPRRWRRRSNGAANTDPDIHQDFPDVQNAFKVLSILGIPHVTMRIAVRCVLPRSPNQGIHRCKYHEGRYALIGQLKSQRQASYRTGENCQAVNKERTPLQCTAFVCGHRVCE